MTEFYVHDNVIGKFSASHCLLISGILHHYPLPIGRRALELYGLLQDFDLVGLYSLKEGQHYTRLQCFLYA